MDTRHEADGVDRERRAAFLFGLVSMSAAVAGGSREAFAQQTSDASRPDARKAVEAFVAKYLDTYNNPVCGFSSRKVVEGTPVAPARSSRRHCRSEGRPWTWRP